MQKNENNVKKLAIQLVDILLNINIILFYKEINQFHIF